MTKKSNFVTSCEQRFLSCSIKLKINKNSNILSFFAINNQIQPSKKWVTKCYMKIHFVTHFLKWVTKSYTEIHFVTRFWQLRNMAYSVTKKDLRKQGNLIENDKNTIFSSLTFSFTFSTLNYIILQNFSFLFCREKTEELEKQDFYSD